MLADPIVGGITLQKLQLIKNDPDQIYKDIEFLRKAKSKSIQDVLIRHSPDVNH